MSSYKIQVDLIPGEEKIYLSCDSAYNTNTTISGPADVHTDVHTSEFLNTIFASRLRNHKLKLKVGVSVILLRNIDQTLGLCNGTRLVITKMGAYVPEAQVISGRHIGHKVFIPWLSLMPSDKSILFNFQRRQFSLFVLFAMTINKTQG